MLSLPARILHKEVKKTAPSFQFSRERDGKWEALGRGCVVLVQRRAVENGGTIHTFREEKIAKLLPKSIARTARIQFEKWHLLFREYLRDWTSPHVHIHLYLRGEEVRSSAGNEEEKVFGARFSRQENSHFRKKQYRHLRLIFSWRKEKKLCVFLKRFAGLFCDPGIRVTLKEFGGE